MSNYSQGHLQQPHLDMSMDHYGGSKVKLGFMPLTKNGTFLEVWPPGQLVAQLAFIKYGTIFYLDKSVIHAGGFAPNGSEALRLQFVFSESALDVEHFQIKSGEEFVHNYVQQMNDAQVRSECITTIID